MQLFTNKTKKYDIFKVNAIVSFKGARMQFIQDCIFTENSFKDKKTFLDDLQTDLQLSKKELIELIKISLAIHTDNKLNTNHWFFKMNGKFYIDDLKTLKEGV